MAIYFLAYAIFLLFHGLYVALREPDFFVRGKRKYLCIIFFIVLLAILGLRHPSMGHDLRYGETYGYLGMYEYIANLSWAELFTFPPILNYEYGYVFYCKLLSYISLDPQFLLFVSAALSIAPIVYIIYTKKTNPTLSLFIYIGLPAFMITYSGIRQGLAIGMCFLAITFIEKKKLFKFIFLVSLASFFHGSAIIFFIAYPLYHVKLSKRNRYFSILLIPFCYALRYPLFKMLSVILKENAVAEETGSFTLLLVFCAIYVFGMLYMDYTSVAHNGYMNLFLLACACQVFGSISNSAMRVGYYFMLILLLLLPDIISRMKLYSNRRLTEFIVVMCFAVFGLYSIRNATWAMAYPYYFFWEVI